MEAKGVCYMGEIKKYKDIVEGLKKGEISLIFDWVDINKTKLYRIAWAYLRNYADVEDAFHNTIIKVIENIKKLNNDDAFEAWFISILLNESRIILRHRKRVVPSEEVEANNCFSDIDNEDTKFDLIRGLKSIEEEYKDVIILKYYSGYSQKEIAEILNMPIGTVKTKIYRGLKALRKVLGREV